MGKGMDLEKNIILKEENLLEYLEMGKNGMELDMIKIIILTTK